MKWIVSLGSSHFIQSFSLHWLVFSMMALLVSKAITELQNLLNKSGYKPYRSAAYSFLQVLLECPDFLHWFVIYQIPPFVAIMVGLREMANLPVASLQSGGMLWFTDLTMYDPYYILPVTTMLLLLLQLEVAFHFGFDRDHFWHRNILNQWRHL